MKSLLIITALMGLASAELWAVTDRSTNKTCVLVESSSATVTVKFTANITIEYTVPIHDSRGDESDSCTTIDHDGKKVLKLTRNWYPANESSTEQEWQIDLYFEAVDKLFKLVDYTLTTAPAVAYPSAVTYTFRMAKDAPEDVRAGDKNGYQCSTTTLALSNATHIDLKAVRTVAFVDLDQPSFDKKQQFELCALDSRTSDIVPIIVGALLAGLVVVVLIAYLIGRARAKRQGYASV